MIRVEYGRPSRMNILHFFQLRCIVQGWIVAARVSREMRHSARIERKHALHSKLYGLLSR